MVCGPSPLSALPPARAAQREDLRALAIVLLECILSALAFSGPSQLTNADSIQVRVRGAGGEDWEREREPVTPLRCSRCHEVWWAGAFGDSGCPYRPASAPAPAALLQRLLGEVFVWGVDDFRCGLWDALDLAQQAVAAAVAAADAATARRRVCNLPKEQSPHVPAPHSPPSSAPRRRQYCQDEPDWQAAVELLSQDEGAGWRLLQELVAGGRGAAELAADRFCQL